MGVFHKSEPLEDYTDMIEESKKGSKTGRTSIRHTGFNSPQSLNHSHSGSIKGPSTTRGRRLVLQDDIASDGGNGGSTLRQRNETVSLVSVQKEYEDDENP